MTKRLASHNPVMEVLFTRSLTSQLTRCESSTDRILVGIFGPGLWRLGRVQVVGKGMDLEGKQHVVWVLTRWIIEAHPPKCEGGGAVWKDGSQQILFVLHVSQGKNMSSSSIVHVHSVWGEHLHSGRAPNILTPVPERVRTNCKLMWVVNVSPICFFWGKNKPFSPQSKVWYGSFLIAFFFAQAF